MTESQAKNRKVCKECLKRKWNGHRIWDEKLWAARDRIVAVHLRPNAGKKWELKCPFEGCENTFFRAGNATASGYCRFHATVSQREPFFQAFQAVTRRARQRRGHSSSLTLADVQQILQSGTCTYCGRPHGAPRFLKHSKATSCCAALDRVDPTRPYEKGNVVACCYACNTKKGFVMCAADMFDGGVQPQNWPADSFFRSAAHNEQAKKLTKFRTKFARKLGLQNRL